MDFEFAHRYVITNEHGQFLVKLQDSKATWSVVAHDVIASANAWVRLADAEYALKLLQSVMKIKLSINRVRITWTDGRWGLASQEGI